MTGPRSILLPDEDGHYRREALRLDWRIRTDLRRPAPMRSTVWRTAWQWRKRDGGFFSPRCAR